MPALLHHFETDRSEAVRELIAGAILRWKSGDAFSTMLARLYTEESPVVMERIFQEIRSLNDDRILNNAWLESEECGIALNRERRRQAILALKLFRNDPRGERILRRLDDAIRSLEESAALE